MSMETGSDAAGFRPVSGPFRAGVRCFFLTQDRPFTIASPEALKIDSGGRHQLLLDKQVRNFLPAIASFGQIHEPEAQHRPGRFTCEGVTGHPAA